MYARLSHSMCARMFESARVYTCLNQPMCTRMLEPLYVCTKVRVSQSVHICLNQPMCTCMYEPFYVCTNVRVSHSVHIYLNQPTCTCMSGQVSGHDCLKRAKNEKTMKKICCIFDHVSMCMDENENNLKEKTHNLPRLDKGWLQTDKHT